MSVPKQNTVGAETCLEGVGLHTGARATVRFRPAPPGHGVRFHRTDLAEGAVIQADLEHVVSTDRGTSLAAGNARVDTVEHLLAAVGALGIDNLLVELDGPEVPIADGSFRPFLTLLQEGGTEAQDADATVLELGAPITSTSEGGASYVATPAETLRVSATIQFDHPLIGRQFGSFDVRPDSFADELAAARTFGFMREAEALRARGLALGASVENALVLDDRGLAPGSEALRWPDEFVRHKVGDVVGDLALLGARVRAHVVADRPSHAGNLALARALRAAAEKGGGQRPIVDIQRIMQHLPHRFPMLLVDRIVEWEGGKRIVGIKNVTINEPFFQGHYPDHPVMPGVLIIEAMAQVGGLLLMDAVENPEEKVVYFMSLDKVKWRRPVTPGDQIRFELEMVQFRRHTCRMKGQGFVDGKLVAEAEMMARIVER